MWEFTPPEFESSYNDGYIYGITINGSLKDNPYDRRLSRNYHYYWNNGLFDGRKQLIASQSLKEENAQS